MSESLAEALAAWGLMIERRLARIERALGLPPEPPERPDDAPAA